MQASLETLEGLQRRLNVAIPLSEIDGEVDNRLKRISRTAKMPGFRPGKVPFKVVAQQYGPQVRQEVMGEKLEQSFGDAVREQNLKVAGYPKFDASPPAEGGADFQYSATFEVYPEFVVGDISGKTISRPQLAITDTEIDKTLEIMRKQRVTYNVVERAAQSTDRVKIDYRGTIDGVEFAGGVAKDQSTVLGGGRLLPDFDKQLEGMTPGEEKAFDLKFPDNYHVKDLVGKTARFEVKVTEVAEAILPVVDAEFAKSLGVADGDIAKMRGDVKANLEREVQARLKSRVKDQVMQAFLDVTTMQPPKSLIDMEVSRLQQSMRDNLVAQGMQVKDELPMPAEVFQQSATRRVTLGLILGEVVRVNGLQAKPEQVRAAVELQAQSYEQPQELVKWYYQSPERLQDIEALVVEENVVEWATRVAKLEDKPMSFDELMENK